MAEGSRRARMKIEEEEEVEEEAGVEEGVVAQCCCIINNLPEQVLESIFNRLESGDDRGSASQVCKMWQKLDGRTRRSVYISNCYSIAPSDLSERFQSLQKIKIKGKPRAYEFGLLVENWGGFAGPWIAEIGRAYPKLQCLHLRRMDVKDEDLKVLATHCRFLNKLKLNKCCGFSTTGLQYISEFCRGLRVIDLEESDEMEDQGGPWLEMLLHGEGALESLNLASAGLVEEENIKQSMQLLAPRLKTLSSLKVSDMELDSFFKILDHSMVPVLQIGLGCYSSCPEEPKELATSFSHRLSVLRVLDLKFATMSAEIQIELLRHCNSLQKLELRSAVGDKGMQVIGECCKQLKRIRVDHINADYMTDYVTQTGMIAICEGCRHLDFFVMYLADVNNEALAAVGRCLPNLTDFRIVLLEALPHVEGLPLDDGVRSLLQGCPLLTRFSVYLRKGGLTDRGLGYIGEFGAKLKWVLLGCSGDSDEGLRLMADGCRQLERLEMRGCPFGDSQLASSVLTVMTRLKYLWVQGVGATPALGAALVSRNPGFVVEFIAERSQMLGYYTVTSPRKDNPASVCLIYPKRAEEELATATFYPEYADSYDVNGGYGEALDHADDCNGGYGEALDHADDCNGGYGEALGLEGHADVANGGYGEALGLEGHVDVDCNGGYGEALGFEGHVDGGENGYYSNIDEAGLYFGFQDTGEYYPDYGDDSAYVFH